MSLPNSLTLSGAGISSVNGTVTQSGSGSTYNGQPIYTGGFSGCLGYGGDGYWYVYYQSSPGGNPTYRGGSADSPLSSSGAWTALSSGNNPPPTVTSADSGGSGGSGGGGGSTPPTTTPGDPSGGSAGGASTLAYSFNAVALPYVERAAAPMPSRITAAQTPGRPGAYPGVQRVGERKATVAGTLTAPDGGSFDDLLDLWSALCAAHDTFTPAPLYIRDNWYLWALCESIAEVEVGPDHIKYQADYRASDPYFYSATVSAPAIGTNGGTFTALGNKPAAPSIALTVSAVAAGGTITATNTTTGETFILTPAVTGTYTLDSRLQTIVAPDGSDATAQFVGTFLSLPPGSNTLNIATAGGAAISAAAIAYNARRL